MKWNFSEQLRRFGPGAKQYPLSRAEAWQYCRELARTHYENFSVTSLLLPRRLHKHFHSIYAYCRWADDLGDETGGGQRALDLLAWWREQLRACYQGKGTHPVFIALADTVETYAIPQQPFDDLITAFEQDQRVSIYPTFGELLDYCKYSANPVGRLVLYLFESCNERSGELSDLICTALQLTNFWQDVSRDLSIGRIYLPTEDRLRFGVGMEDLQARRFTPAFGELMRFEVERTIEMFYRGYPLVDLVPAEVESEIELFIEGGMAILHKIEKAGFNVLSQRPALAKWEKAKLVVDAACRKVRRQLLGARKG